MFWVISMAIGVEMRNNRYNLEGERYKGKFKGSRNRKEVTKKEYMWDRKENYF